MADLIVCLINFFIDLDDKFILMCELIFCYNLLAKLQNKIPNYAKYQVQTWQEELCEILKNYYHF